MSASIMDEYSPLPQLDQKRQNKGPESASKKVALQPQQQPKAPLLIR